MARIYSSHVMNSEIVMIMVKVRPPVHRSCVSVPSLCLKHVWRARGRDYGTLWDAVQLSSWWTWL